MGKKLDVMTRVEQRKLQKMLRAFLLARGAVDVTSEQLRARGDETLVIATRGGTLTIELGSVVAHGLSCGGAIFSRFETPALAAPLTSCNPHSGKWNHHPGREAAERVMADFEAAFRKVEIPVAVGVDVGDEFWAEQARKRPTQGERLLGAAMVRQAEAARKKVRP